MKINELAIQKAAQRTVGTKLDRVGRAVGFELLRRLIQATPVDTGRARGNWNASIGQEDPRTDDDRRSQAALTEGKANIDQLSLWRAERLFITNGLPYIGRLNDGWSKQAPAAFVQGTVRDMRAYVEHVARLERLRLDVDIPVAEIEIPVFG